MKKKLYPRKFCKWVVEARWIAPETPYNKDLLNWNRVYETAFDTGRQYYSISPSYTNDKPMEPLPLEEVIARAKEERWSNVYEFRFKNIRTKEEISFALFPEIEVSKED